MDTTTDLNTLTSELYNHYTEEKEAKKELFRVRQQFFDALSKEIEASTQLRQQTFVIEGFDTPEEYVAKWFPGWRLLPDQPGPSYVIEEDPACIKHSYISESLGLVFSRGVAQGTPELDDELLQMEDPVLWKKITYCPAEELLQDLVDSIGGDVVPGIVKQYVQERGDHFERVLKDLDTLSEEDLAALVDFLVPGRLTIKLEPPRKLKSDEIDE